MALPLKSLITPAESCVLTTLILACLWDPHRGGGMSRKGARNLSFHIICDKIFLKNICALCPVSVFLVTLSRWKHLDIIPTDAHMSSESVTSVTGTLFKMKSTSFWIAQMNTLSIFALSSSVCLQIFLPTVLRASETSATKLMRAELLLLFIDA